MMIITGANLKRNMLKEKGTETKVTDWRKLSSYTLLESFERFLRFKETCCYWTSRT